MNDGASGYVIPGLKVTLRGVDRVVPPLNLDQVQELTPQIVLVAAAGKTGITKEVNDAARQLFVAAVRRNYPDYSEEEAGRDLDMGNLASIIKAVLGRSGAEEPAVAGKA